MGFKIALGAGEGMSFVSSGAEWLKIRLSTAGAANYLTTFQPFKCDFVFFHKSALLFSTCIQDIRLVLLQLYAFFRNMSRRPVYIYASILAQNKHIQPTDFDLSHI